MFEIFNKEGAKIAHVSEKELDALRKDNLIKSTDRIYDADTKERVDNR